jgi:hypothetical protein
MTEFSNLTGLWLFARRSKAHASSVCVKLRLSGHVLNGELASPLRVHASQELTNRVRPHLVRRSQDSHRLDRVGFKAADPSLASE